MSTRPRSDGGEGGPLARFALGAGRGFGLRAAPGHDLSAAAFLGALVDGGEVPRALTRALCEAPFEAAFLELAPITRGGDSAFEAVVLDAPALASAEEDPRPFRQVFAAGPPGEDVATFPNLGGDAVLVAPRPRPSGVRSAHLLAFLRTGSTAEALSLFAAVGRAGLDALARGWEPLWLSTSGLGVAWLHVRLDRRPKYITHAPYRSVGSTGTRSGT